MMIINDTFVKYYRDIHQHWYPLCATIDGKMTLFTSIHHNTKIPTEWRNGFAVFAHDPNWDRIERLTVYDANH